MGLRGHLLSPEQCAGHSLPAGVQEPAWQAGGAQSLGQRGLPSETPTKGVTSKPLVLTL